MKTLIVLLASASLLGCSSYQSGQGGPGAMEGGSVGSEGSSQRMGDLQQRGEDTEHNATRRDIGGSFGGSGGTAPGGVGIGPR